MKSIVESPWNFACQWYRVTDVLTQIRLPRDENNISDFSRMPEDVYSDEFAEWLTEQYRLAMCKGAELAIAEMRDKPCVHELAKQCAENTTSDYRLIDDKTQD
jgi:hypothetical protein